MKIVVGVKRVVDFNVNIRVRADGSGIETSNVKMSMNPFDEIALEEAIRLREAGAATEIIAVSIGPERAQDILRSALAMGADRAILILSEASVEPLGVAKILAATINEEKADLALLGKQAIDDDSNQTGQMLAALLNWPQATFASAVAITNGHASVTREIDGGTQTLDLTLPAVITVDLRLNVPRYATLPNVMKAKSKPLLIRPVSETGVDIAPRLTILHTEAPPARQAGAILGSVGELVGKLKSEAGVL